MSHLHPWEDSENPGNGPRWRTGEACVTRGCTNPAGTCWSPLWCQPCNAMRINHISASLAEAQRRMDGIAKLTQAALEGGANDAQEGKL